MELLTLAWAISFIVLLVHLRWIGLLIAGIVVLMFIWCWLINRWDKKRHDQFVDAQMAPPKIEPRDTSDGW